ncbi:type VII secretion target [Mycobacterium haemophilum]
MSEQRLEVDADQLRQWATAHDQAADACTAALQDDAQTIAAAQSWGPLFSAARRAAVDAVNAREAALITEEQRHRAMARELRASADKFDAMNAANQANLTITTE